MNKNLIIAITVIAVVLIIGIIIATNNMSKSPGGDAELASTKADGCYDSDGGLNYNSFGNVTAWSRGRVATDKDVCINLIQLEEKYCKYSAFGTPLIGRKFFNCSSTGKVCKNGACVKPCTPNCVGRNCGDDGCGGSCGTCPSNQGCNSSIGRCFDICQDSCAKIFKVSIINGTTGYDNDRVRFTDIKTQLIYESTITSEGSGTVTIGGIVYQIQYIASQTTSQDNWYVIINNDLAKVFKNNYFAIPVITSNCQDSCAKIFKVSIINGTTGYENDKVTLTDIKVPEILYNAVMTSEGSGTITLEGRVYLIQYSASDRISRDNWYVSVNQTKVFNRNYFFLKP